MQLGKAIGTACSTFAITNIDDMFVLVTFFAEAASNRSTTSLKITLGQYIGFSVIMAVSMIGFGVALVLPSEPIGFLGLLPILLSVWKGLHLLFPRGEEQQDEEREEGGEVERVAETERGVGIWAKLKKGGMKPIFNVAMITIMNGGDNIGTYIPLFSQAEGAEIAVYVVIYYILLGVWVLIAWLVMKQKHILRVAEKWADVVVPFLYVGLGIYIVVKSNCYPWSIEKIDETVVANPGKVSMGVSTAVVMLTCIAAMIWLHWKKHTPLREASIHELEQGPVKGGAGGEDQGKTKVDTGAENPAGGSASPVILLDNTKQEGGKPETNNQTLGNPKDENGDMSIQVANSSIDRT